MKAWLIRQYRWNVKTMYVCLCKGVTDRDIRKAVAEGASSLREVRDCTGAMTQCGRCRQSTREVLQESLIQAVQHYPAVA